MSQQPSVALRDGVRTTYVAFFGSGLAFASWASRIPQVRDRLHLTPAELGMVLLSIAAGSLLALPLSGPLVHRLGPARTVAGMAALLGAGLATAALGYRLGVPALCLGLFVLGFGNGGWDVAMNVHGALVEQRLGRSIMSRFHAGYSLGTVAGALVGAAMVALGIPVTVHLLAVAVAVAVAVPAATRRFLPEPAPAPRREDARDRTAFAAWREPRTLAIGLFVLAFAFAEGAGNDWIAVATIDGHHASAFVGTLAFATFLAAMTAARWFAPAVLDRHGRVATVRGLAVLGLAGSLLFVLAPGVWPAFLGAAVWGAGVSVGFPVGMSAGSDEPRYAAGRVSAIASIGYGAFLVGPPAVGFLGGRVGVLAALVLVAVLLGAAAGISRVVAPLA